VLVIEDHAATQNVLISVLALHGYQVVCAANGQEALDWLHTALPKGQQPAIILLDLFMPVMNGADFLAGMRAEWPGLLQAPPVILFTVDQSNHDDLACTDVLLKPFHIRDLLQSFAGSSNKRFSPSAGRPVAGSVAFRSGTRSAADPVACFFNQGVYPPCIAIMSPPALSTTATPTAFC